MTLLDPQVRPAPANADVDPDALIKEARRLRRRRWILRSALTALAAGAGAAGCVAGFGPPSNSHHPAPASPSSPPGLSVSARVLAPTRSPDLIQPTTLATLPDGNLLILDSSRDQILEVAPDGDMSVFAGDGRLGFSGDGGPARDAELDLSYFSSAGLTVAPNGTVDVLDDGNCRVRAIQPSGVIRTVLHIPLVKLGPHATGCPVTTIAVSPTGRLYVATDSEVERVSPTGRLTSVAGAQDSKVQAPKPLTARNVMFTPVSLAFARGGDLDIASFSPKAIYQLTPAGKLTDLGAIYATELAQNDTGTVLAGTHGGEIETATPAGIQRFYTVIPRRVSGISWGTDAGFQENGIAITGTGTIYVDNANGNGYGAATVLVRVSRSRHAALVPIRTPLADTLPRVGGPGFPARLYPAARPTHGPALTACPSDTALEPFTPGVIAHAEAIAQTYLSSQFASDLAVTDRSWWTADFNDSAAGADLGRHTLARTTPGIRSPIARGLAQACGPELVRDSLAVTVSRSAYSNFTGTLYLLDRAGHALVFDVRR